MSRTVLPAIALPRDPHAGELARAYVEEHLRPRMSDNAVGNVKLVVSELINNAICHGSGRITMAVVVGPETVRVEVVDEGHGDPQAIVREGGSGVGGWGLRVVDHLALRWGAATGSTHVWAELRLDA